MNIDVSREGDVGVIEVFIEDLAICEHCGAVFHTGGRFPREIAFRLRCQNISCQFLLTWQSLGKVCVGAGGIYTRVKWVGPDKKWVSQKPANSFFIGNWWVLPYQTSETDKARRLFLASPKGEEKQTHEGIQHVVWCQKWGTRSVSGGLTHAGYSLHTTIKRLRDFVARRRKERSSFIPLDGPYQCLISQDRFRLLFTAEKRREEGDEYDPTNYLNIPPPRPYNPKSLGRNVFQIIVTS